MLAALSLGSGCANLTQKVTLAPQAKIEAQPLGPGVSTALSVVDERADSSLGNRVGGYGTGARIELANDIVAVVRAEFERGLAGLGVALDKASATSMRVDIRELQYKGTVGMFTAGVSVQGALKVSIAKNGKTFEKLYRLDEKEDRHVVVPTAGQNEEKINESLGILISKALNDPELLAFLSS